MVDPTYFVGLASAGLAGVSIAAAATLKGWNGWLELKRLEIAREARSETGRPSPIARIELADLKERVRKLEAIANGVDIQPRGR